MRTFCFFISVSISFDVVMQHVGLTKKSAKQTFVDVTLT